MSVQEALDLLKKIGCAYRGDFNDHMAIQKALGQFSSLITSYEALQKKLAEKEIKNE